MKILIAASNMVHINNFHLPYIETFKSQGHSVSIMASGVGADFDIPFKKSTLSVKNLCLASKIRKIIKQEAFDVIYLHTTLAAFWVRMALVGLKKRPKVVNTVHGYLFGKDSSWLHNFIYLSCERLLKSQTDNIVVMNKEDYQIATKNKLCRGDVYIIDGMGVDFGKIEKAQPHPKEGNLNIAFVGEISKRKNQLFLVKALSNLPDYTLTLVGDGDQRAKIEKYIKKHNLQNRVKITGFTKNPYGYIKKCHIYASASKIEGLPFNIMEAMYLEKTVIASDIKGHCDLLDKEHLFPLNDMDKFVSLIKAVKNGTSKKDVEKYSKEAVLDSNMAIYLSLAQEKTQQTVV